MFNFKTALRHAFAALALASIALAAHAGPTYHVTVDSTAFAAGDAGYLDLGFFGVGGSAEALATVSHLQGDIVSIDPFSSHYTEPTAGVFVLSNQLDSYLSHDVLFGGMFSFDVTFSGDFLTSFGANQYVSPFTVALYDADFATLASLQLNATQLSDFGPANVAVAAGAVAADATLVPEPSELLLMMTGLGLAGFMVRRRKGPAA